MSCGTLHPLLVLFSPEDSLCHIIEWSVHCCATPASVNPVWLVKKKGRQNSIFNSFCLGIFLFKFYRETNLSFSDCYKP